MNPYILGGGASAAVACTTANDEAIYDTTATSPNNIQSGDGGQQFTTSATWTVTQYKMYLEEGANPETTFTIGLYDDSSNQKGTLITGTDVTLTKDDIPGTMAVVTVTLPTPVQITARTMWLVVSSTSVGTPQVGLYLGNPDGYILYGETSYSNSYSIPSAVFGCQ